MSEKVILIILDGWGIGQNTKVDAIAQANTPCFDSLLKSYPNATLTTFGEEVGLPEGQMGNSEVGHMNLGAGRIVYQELARINKAIREKTLEKEPAMLQIVKYCTLNQKPVHILGCLSDGGVHSHIEHIEYCADFFNKNGIQNGYIHAFLDGRDTSPHGGEGFVTKLLKKIENTSIHLASVIGRYYAMDRDHRWERVKKAYDLLIHGHGNHDSDILNHISENYKLDITDEFMPPWFNPACLKSGTIKPGDAVLLVNFRTDRPRELTEALTQREFHEYEMKPLPLFFTTMTMYNEAYKDIHVIYKRDELNQTLGETIALNNLKQTRIAETEKYPHVTFFFNGGQEEPFAFEQRILIPSPKVATYDQAPEMSANEVKNAVLSCIKNNDSDFICVNFANTDMVGHTGVFNAAIKAAEIVDACLCEIVENANQHNYVLIILADHGNSDVMINPDGTPNTAHTKNPVPCIFVSKHHHNWKITNGKLADIAPTILTLMNIPIPLKMTGNILLDKK